ncbi:MAG: gliding motility-associated C-terminal domain-containing protein, partial [Chitinophagales bacterium]|nr:gliding motility-associated C-terminal domain-containing protein [Chitinophagales bacterium]
VGGAPGYRYLWNTTAQTASISKLKAGDYSVTVYDSKNCTATASATLTQPDEIVILPPDTVTLKIGKSLPLNIQVTPFNPFYSFEWRPRSGLSCYDCPNPVASPIRSIDYTVIVKDQNGCADTLAIPLNVNTDKSFFIPNFFTPNDDGSNDLWCVYSDALQSIDLKVFNRWGEMVFASKDINLCWDGYYNGQKVEPGMYVYVVRFSFIDETWTQRQGSVMVYR